MQQLCALRRLAAYATDPYPAVFIGSRVEDKGVVVGGGQLSGHLRVGQRIAQVDEAALALLGSVMVASNTYRNPAMLTKIITTIDHISDGRAILGVGAGWAEHEHEGFGFEFGASVGERLRWLREALPLSAGIWSSPTCCFWKNTSAR